MSNTEGDSNDKVVGVTSKGQATIPKEFRDRLGITTPGRVKFSEREDGSVVVEPVKSIDEFRGIIDAEEESPTETLERERAEDREREPTLGRTDDSQENT